MITASVLTQLSAYIFYILLPLLALYIVYLIITKAFKDMGFTSVEAIIIVFVSFLLGSGLFDEYVGFSFSNIPLFTYENWIVGINTGGAIIPIILSIYLTIKNKLQWTRILMGIVIVAIITYFVTFPDPQRGIVSTFPFWLLPVVFASIASITLSWNDKHKAAPLAYISGTIGVLIGADVFHLMQLLGYEISTKTPAVIGGANVFDMVFITGILAVILDGILIYKEKRT
jgi:uncharacterized membrane protein